MIIKQLNKKFDKMDEKFDKLDEKFDKLDDKLDKTNLTLENVAGKVDNLQAFLVEGNKMLREMQTIDHEHILRLGDYLKWITAAIIIPILIAGASIIIGLYK